MASGIKSTYVELEGTLEWAKLFEHNRDLKGYNDSYVDTNGRTTVNMILDEANYEKLRKSGSLKRGKPDPDGRGMNVKFDRKWETGRDFDGGPPAIYRADGNPWDVEADGEIGNGSKGRVLVVVTYFPGPKSYSTRIEKVKILEHVTYDGPADSFKKDESGSVGAVSQPQQVQQNQDLEDEIPF